MTDKELKRLSRSELLEMLIALAEENQKLQSRLEAAEEQLSDRRITIEKAGNLAEASLALNGVFEAAQAAAQQYLENIQQLSRQQNAIEQKLRSEAEAQAAQIRQEAEEYSKKLHSEADLYWEEMQGKAEKLFTEQKAFWSAIFSTDGIDDK